MAQDSQYPKIKKLLILIFVGSSLIANAQVPAKVTDFDTINIIQTKIFEYIQTTIDSISFHNFSRIQKGVSKTIYYVNTDTSEHFYQSILQNHDFRNFMKGKSPFREVIKQHSKREIVFQRKKNPSYTKAYCSLLIFPLVRFEDKIFCYLLATSEDPGISELIGEIIFAFDEQLKIIKMGYGESIDRLIIPLTGHFNCSFNPSSVGSLNSISKLLP